MSVLKNTCPRRKFAQVVRACAAQYRGTGKGLYHRCISRHYSRRSIARSCPARPR